jgi:hypothetical protein
VPTERPLGYSLEAMNIRTQNGKQYVLCAWRRRYVRLTPEEYVRQTVLHALETQFEYPHARIGVEVPIEIAGLKKRCDAIVFNQQMQPQILIEFKAETVPLTQQVFDQAAIYNRHLKVPYLMLSNGQDTIMAEILATKYRFLNYIPNYFTL